MMSASSISSKKNCLLAAIFMVTLVTILTTPLAQAEPRWCYTTHPTAIFCDDFDHYCIEPPADPNEACPSTGTGCTKDNYTARSVWRNQDCGVQINLSEGPACDGLPYVTTNPYGAKYPKGQLGHMKVNLEQFILGTDENPLVLDFVLNGQTGNKIYYANTFMELALLDVVTGEDHRAPTDYIYSTGCSTAYPIICQQDNPPADCPDIATAPHRASIAVGAVAYLDKSPCEGGSAMSANTNLAVFDGYKWWTLPGTFMGSGNFQLNAGPNRIRITIASNVFAVELMNGVTSSWCDIPRDYLGGFNKLHMGFGQSCLIDQETWTCAEEMYGDRRYQCIDSVRVNDFTYAMVGPVYDNIVLYGGEVYPLTGACCLNDGTCTDVIEEDCQSLGGRFSGPGSGCAFTLCCPYPFADGDGDGDVDQQDFGLFQACFSGRSPLKAGCECYDRNDFTGEQGGDGIVDADDFAWLENCVSGPSILLNVENPPTGCIP